MEGSGRVLFMVLFQNFPGWIEDNQEELRMAGLPDEFHTRSPEYKSHLIASLAVLWRVQLGLPVFHKTSPLQLTLNYSV
jgi:hypothetical protein